MSDCRESAMRASAVTHRRFHVTCQEIATKLCHEFTERHCLVEVRDHEVIEHAAG